MMTASPAPISSAADLRGRQAIVLGLARSGVAAARFLADQGATVTVYDRRSADELAGGVASLEARPLALALGVEPRVARDLLVGADLVVTSPSVSPRFPTTDAWLREALTEAEARGTELVSEVELFLRLTHARVLAITGTKGKTTSTALVAAMLEAAGMPAVVGGNIGTPLVERALELSQTTWAVLELSELQLPTISRGADVALYTNIGADHLDRHGSVASYRAVKARLAELSQASGLVVLNADDPGCVELGSRLPDERLAWYGLSPVSGRPLAATVEGGTITLAGAPLIDVDEVPLPGRHMRANVLGAAVAARFAGADPSAIGRAIREFPGVPHRLETVADVSGVRWVNDSQATIPMAAIAALESFESPIVLIAGGQGKGLDQEPFAEAIVANCRAAVLLGETAGNLEALVAGRIPVRRAASMDEAVVAARDEAHPGDVVLLAPAAASFDMFADYAARGDAFRAAVSRLEASR
jgi:UDP-N-acetylmuramoylalanine--D-glutamate ligase